MDSTELHYVTYDPEEIWVEMQKAYVAAGGDILYSGDEKEMLLRSVQAIVTQAFAGVDNALRMATLRYAVKSYLDLIGELRGCYRIEAAPATMTVAITTATTGSATTLPAGTAMTADGEVFFLLDEDLELSGYAETLTAAVTCEQAGTKGNALTAGTALVLAVPNPAVAGIVAATDASGGNEEEQDEAYRARIREYGLVSVTTGPEERYEALAKEVSSEILDASAVQLAAGSVGVYLLFSDDVSGKSAIITAVEDALSGETVRPLTDQVHVYEANESEYTLTITCTYDGSATVKDAIDAAVANYTAWQDNVIGQDLQTNRLVAFLYTAGCSAVNITASSSTPFTPTSGDPEYGLDAATLKKTVRWKGTIAITYVTA